MQRHLESAKRAALLWGLPTCLLAGLIAYLKTRSLVHNGSPPDTLRRFWWPFAPLFLIGWLLFFAALGVVAQVVIDLLSPRRQAGE